MDVKSLAIAQPTFLPWSGWYDLVDQVDLLILLDDVAFSKQSWQQRNRIRTPDGLSYLTVPVQTAGKLGQRICDTNRLPNNAFVRKIERTVARNYRRAEYFDRYYPEFCAVLERLAASENLSELNCGLIEWLAAGLGITTPTVRSSQLGVGGKRGAHVAMLCEEFHARRKNTSCGGRGGLSHRRSHGIRGAIDCRRDSRLRASGIQAVFRALRAIMQTPLTYFSTKASALGPSCYLAADRDALCGRAKRQREAVARSESGNFWSRWRAPRRNEHRLSRGCIEPHRHRALFPCLTLAEALKQSGWRVSFVCRHLPDELQTMLSERGIAFSKIGGFEPSKMSADLRHSHWLGTF